MMTTYMPKIILEYIQKVQRAFIWVDQGTTRKLHVVGWKSMMLTKNNGGMAMCNVTTMNTACLMKMRWALKSCDYGLWGEVI